MRALLTGASAAAILLAAGGASAQDAGAANGQGAERGANELTCRDLSAIDTALVPGVLYFIAGHREGAAGAMADPQGAMPGMEDATADEQPATADAGTELDPAVEDEVELTDPEADAEAADLGEDDDGDNDNDTGDNDTGAADDTGAEDQAEETAGMGEAGADAEAPAPATDMQTEAAGMAGNEAAPTAVRVRGHFEIPIERTIIACADTPDALAGDVIEEQRTASPAENGDNDDAAEDDEAEEG